MVLVLWNIPVFGSIPGPVCHLVYQTNLFIVSVEVVSSTMGPIGYVINAYRLIVEECVVSVIAFKGTYLD
jgi:hypothetical protein